MELQFDIKRLGKVFVLMRYEIILIATLNPIFLSLNSNKFLYTDSI